MLFGFAADIHANLPALEAVRKKAAELGVGRLFLLGDLVNYGPHPAEVVRRAAEEGWAGVLGNHDLTSLGEEPPIVGPRRNQRLEELCWEFTRSELGAAERRFLAALPFSRRPAELGGLWLRHATGSSLTEYLTAESPDEDFRREFGASRRIVVAGHTHSPFARRLGGNLWLNAGSVGRPKDGDPRAALLLLRTETLEFDWIRLSYPWDSLEREYRRRGLPPVLLETLRTGRELPGPDDIVQSPERR